MLIGNCLHHIFGSGASRSTVLRDISLSIRPGELTLIAGPSGCGKSTLLAILCGLLQPFSGSVRALGRDLSALSTTERERFRLEHMGFVFQTFSLFPSLSAIEQVCLPLAYLGFGKATAERRAVAALAAVGLADRAAALPRALSGGEQQRIAVARAIAKAPRILLADEPTSALDSANGQRVIELLRGIAHEQGAIAICVSHDPRLIGKADRVLEMQDGSIHADSTVSSLKTAPAAS